MAPLYWLQCGERGGDQLLWHPSRSTLSPNAHDELPDGIIQRERTLAMARGRGTSLRISAGEHDD